MNFLIATASSKIYLVIFDKTSIKACFIHRGHNNHTQRLYELLAVLNIEAYEFDKIYIVNGPGSFTGLRVGIVFAKTLAMKLQKPLYPLNYLELLQSMYQQQVYIDAKGGNYITLDQHTMIISNTINDNSIIDPDIDIKQLINNTYISSITPVNYLELGIEYVKNPLH